MIRLSPRETVAGLLWLLSAWTVVVEAESAGTAVPIRIGQQSPRFAELVTGRLPGDRQVGSATATVPGPSSSDIAASDVAASDFVPSDGAGADSHWPPLAAVAVADPPSPGEGSEQYASPVDSEAQRRQQVIDGQIAALQQSVSSIRISVAADGPTPTDQADQRATERPTIAITGLGIGPPLPHRSTVCWVHQPLLYEQPNLERCGQGYGCWQTKISAAQFLWNTALLPYHWGREGCHGYQRAGGDCLCGQEYPCGCSVAPGSPRGALSQAAAWAGFSLLLL